MVRNRATVFYPHPFCNLFPKSASVGNPVFDKIRWMDGWMNRGMDGWMERQVIDHTYIHTHIIEID